MWRYNHTSAYIAQRIAATAADHGLRTYRANSSACAAAAAAAEDAAALAGQGAEVGSSQRVKEGALRLNDTVLSFARLHS